MGAGKKSKTTALPINEFESWAGGLQHLVLSKDPAVAMMRDSLVCPEFQVKRDGCYIYYPGLQFRENLCYLYQPTKLKDVNNTFFAGDKLKQKLTTRLKRSINSEFHYALAYIPVTNNEGTALLGYLLASIRESDGEFMVTSHLSVQLNVFLYNVTLGARVSLPKLLNYNDQVIPPETQLDDDFIINDLLNSFYSNANLSSQEEPFAPSPSPSNKEVLSKNLLLFARYGAYATLALLVVGALVTATFTSLLMLDLADSFLSKYVFSGDIAAATDSMLNTNWAEQSYSDEERCWFVVGGLIGLAGTAATGYQFRPKLE